MASGPLVVEALAPEVGALGLVVEPVEPLEPLAPGHFENIPYLPEAALIKPALNDIIYSSFVVVFRFYYEHRFSR